MLYHIPKEIILSKIYIKAAVWKLVPGPFVFAQPLKFLMQSTCIRYVTEKLSKLAQISTLTSSDSFIQIILWKLKFFYKRFYFVMLLRLAIFHYQIALIHLLKWNKNIFPCFTSAFFKHIKQRSKNVRNTTFRGRNNSRLPPKTDWKHRLAG